MTRQNQPREQKEALAVAKGLYGSKRIRAFNLAGRSDLALNYADELLIGKGFNYGRGPEAYSPYNAKDWEALRQKREFDEHGIPYTPEAVRAGLRGTYIEVYSENPSQKEVHTIEDVLAKHNVRPDERMRFFENLRERARKQTTPGDANRFVFERQETPYAVLASHTGVARDEVVRHYLEKLFGPEEFHSIMWNRNDWPQDLSKFVEKEKVSGEQILQLAERTMRDFQTYSFSSTYDHDKPSFCYGLLNGLSQVSGVYPSKELVLRTLKDYVRTGGELFEGYHPDREYPDPLYKPFKDDQGIVALRQQSLRNEVERGPVCLFERVEYGINNLGLNPSEGWLKKALVKHLGRWKKSSEEFDLSSAIYAGEEYGLLSSDKINLLKSRLKLVKSLK